MDESLINRIRNFSLGSLISFMIILFVILLYFSSLMITENTDQAINSFPEVVAKSHINTFLEFDFGTMRSTVEQLTEHGDQLGIAYVGMLDDRGRLIHGRPNPELPEEQRSLISEYYLVSMEDELIIERKKNRVIKGGLAVTEYLVPVRQNNSTFGWIVIGITPETYQADWDVFRYRGLISLIFLGFFGVILFLYRAQNWRARFRDQENKLRNQIENQYKMKLKELESEIESGPLSSDEFFEIIDFGKGLVKHNTPAELIRYLINATAKILNVKQVVVFLLSPEDPSILVGQMGLKDGKWMDSERLNNIKIKLGTGEVGTIAELGQANIIDTPRDNMGVAAALRAEGETIGVLRATEKGTGARMTSKDRLKIRLISQLSGDLIKHSFETG